MTKADAEEHIQIKEIFVQGITPLVSVLQIVLFNCSSFFAVEVG
jgi:hypothetical protein